MNSIKQELVLLFQSECNVYWAPAQNAKDWRAEHRAYLPCQVWPLLFFFIKLGSAFVAQTPAWKERVLWRHLWSSADTETTFRISARQLSLFDLFRQRCATYRDKSWTAGPLTFDSVRRRNELSRLFLLDTVDCYCCSVQCQISPFDKSDSLVQKIATAFPICVYKIWP